jgi:CheY-like chemotaxis protein
MPDYIFLDVRMPLMDGKAVLTELRKNKKLRSVPVIMYSTTVNPQEIGEYESLGANQVLNKFTDFKGLCDALRTFLLKKP